MSGLRFADIETKTLEVLDFTSFVVEEFRALVEPFEEMFQAHVAKWRLDGKPRKARRYSTYKTCPLPTPEDRLLFILAYVKTNPLQFMHGRLFGMPQCKANIWIHLLFPILQSTLAGLGYAPCRSLVDLAKRLNVTMDQASQILEDAGQKAVLEPSEQTKASSQPIMPTEGGPVYCHDGTERGIPRPQDPEDQKLYYSGKKKKHTVKNVLLIDGTLSIIFLSETVEGKMHDKKIADAAPYPLPQGSQLLQDLGFQAFTLNGVQTVTPIKKPRGKDLTPEQKDANRELSRRRVRIEHVNSSVKRCRIVKDVIRLLKDGMRDLVMDVCCALHNFRVSWSLWKPMV